MAADLTFTRLVDDAGFVTPCRPVAALAGGVSTTSGLPDAILDPRWLGLHGGRRRLANGPVRPHAYF